jgi:hypothetical protein
MFVTNRKFYSFWCDKGDEADKYSKNQCDDYVHDWSRCNFLVIINEIMGESSVFRVLKRYVSKNGFFG